MKESRRRGVLAAAAAASLLLFEAPLFRPLRWLPGRATKRASRRASRNVEPAPYSVKRHA